MKATYFSYFNCLKNLFLFLFLILAIAGYSQCATIPTTTFTTLPCSNTGTISVTSPLGANFQYSINGVTYQASPNFLLVASGNYNVTYKDLTLVCTSPPNPVMVGSGSASPTPPAVTTPVYYCQNSAASALTATATAGNTLLWYGTNTTGGVGSATATIPSTAAVGSTTYYVSQTNGVCESTRVPIVVNISAPTSPQLAANPFCDLSNTTTTSVAFDWSNVPGYQGYNYSYSVSGGPLIYGSQVSPSNIAFPVPGPGISITFTIISVIGVPCSPSQTVTCHSNCITTVTPTFNVPTTFCQGAATTTLPTTSTNIPSISGTWNIPVVSTTNVGTVNYTFTPDPILYPCALTKTLAVVINPIVIPSFAAVPATFCQGATAPVLPTTSTNAITGSWNPSSINTAVVGGPITYTFTPVAGQCVTNTPVTKMVTILPLATPNFSVIPAICSGTTPIPILATTSPNGITGSWSPTTVSNTSNGTYTFTPTAGQCASNQVLNVTVTPKVTPNFASIAPICSGTTPIPILANTSPNGVAGTWSPATVSNTANGSYTFTPNANLCANTQTINVVVNPRITPTFAAYAPICQGSTAPVLPTNSNNTPAITGTWSPAIVSNTSSGTYTFSPTPGQCVSVAPTTISITVVPLTTPNFAPIAAFCSGNVAPFLSTTSPNGLDGSWSPSIISNTVSGSYTFTPNADQCGNKQILTVTIIPRTVPNFPQIAPFCTGGIAPILTNTSPNGISGTWNPLTIDNTANGQYVFTPNVGECATIQVLPVTITQPISPNFPDLAFCSGTTPPILPLTSPNGFTGTWNPAVVDNLATATYDFTPTAGQCATSQTIVATVNEATLQSVTWTTTAFDENQVLTILASDAGSYLYQVDFGPFQESNVFSNVLPGTHRVTVKDQNGCSPSIVKDDVTLINYPKFFTPNGDGFHDFWNIVGLENQVAVIYIFDRYGKLLKQISPNGTGWDGTFNGRELPGEDYWFTVDYNELGLKKQYKSHFALKR